MKNMRFKVGDRVLIKSLDWYNENSDDNHNVVFADGWHFSKPMSNFWGKELIIERISHAVNPPHYMMRDNIFAWTDEMIEGLVEEEVKHESKFKVGDEVIAYVEGCVAKFSIKDVRWNNELNKFEYKICSSWHAQV